MDEVFTHCPVCAGPLKPGTFDAAIDAWRSIDSAPKNGTRILANDTGGAPDDIYAVVWDTWIPYNSPQGTEQYGWVTFSGDSGPTCNPTHWMPLPEPPKP